MNRDHEIEIRIRDLRKVYQELVAVDDISFEVHRHEILGFLGPNGAGKTTTINMICGLLPPTSGKILFKEGEVEKVRGKLGICPQENIFWPKLTCREQMIFMAKMYSVDPATARSRSDYLLDIIGLGNKSRVLARKLSGGMKRRLSIALALVHDPEILVLDEPEAGLDPQSRVLVRSLIKEFSKDKTIILTTHNMDEADRLSDRVAIIDQGKLLLIDSPGNLKRSTGEGDLLELLLHDVQSLPKELILDKLNALDCTGTFGDDSLKIQSRNMLEKLPGITGLIGSYGTEIRKMTMRENTLEDVFIHLTGRKLRS